MIDATKETLISFPDAPKHIPGRPHISTLHRWRMRGARGRRLETVLRGGRRFTSIEAIQRFLLNDDPVQIAGTSAKSAEDDEGQVTRELDQLGI